LELGAGAPVRRVDLNAAYTYANYRFRDFTVDTAHYAGNRIPGIPAHSLQASATWRSPLATLVGEATMASDLFVNDANSERAPGYAVFNARLVRDIPLGRSAAELVVGAQNLFDRPYVSSVSVNAAAGKFYEPGTQRALFVGVSLSGGSRPTP
jgi:iron complex outermembrane receptor protein